MPKSAQSQVNGEETTYKQAVGKTQIVTRSIIAICKK